jgi:uncharacterized membrane protein YfcA
MQLLLFLALGLLAEVVGTVGGFGSSVFFVPIAQLFFDYKVVLGITGLFHVFSNLAKLALFWRSIDHRLALLIGVPSVVFVLMGALLTARIDSEAAQLVLGVFLIVSGSAFLLLPKLIIRPTNSNAAAGGAIAGFLAGLLGTGGAIRGATMVGFNLAKNAFVATSAAIDFAVDASRTLVYAKQGYLSGDLYPHIAGLAVVAILGSYLGKLILSRMTQEQFRNIVLILIIGVGLFTVYRSLA